MMRSEENAIEHSVFSSELFHFARRAMLDSAAETERLAALRSSKIFFGDLFRPVRQVLFGKFEDGRDGFFEEVSDNPIIFAPQAREVPAAAKRGAGFVLGAMAGKTPSLESILNAAALGFDGVCLEIGEGDRALLQYLTEVCREVKLSPIWMVKCFAELARVLETDAPYVGLFFENRPPQDPESFLVPFDPCIDVSIRKSIPGEVITLCLYAANGPDSESFLHRIAGQRFDAYVDVSFAQ